MERDPYAPVMVLAKELSGYDIGDEVEQPTVVTRSKHEWIDRVWAEVAPAVIEPRWHKITMIQHKKNGNVRVRTTLGDREYPGIHQIKVREVKK